MRIEIEHLDEDELLENGVFNWPIWEKEESKFDWYYEKTEYCYILEGRVTVVTEFETIELKPGDFVTFPAGLECVWDIDATVRKHYLFE